jgi:lipoprotein-releasing system permease protein
VNFPEAQGLLNNGDAAMGVEIRVDDIDQAAEISHALLRKLGGSPYRVIDWEELNHNLFTALSMQKAALVIFLNLITWVAAFNIVAALTMLVIGKIKEIAILKSMGMRSSSVAVVFQMAGLIIGAIGTAAGLALGLLLCLVVRRYGYHLDARVYLIDELPVKIRFTELALIAGITMAISFIATIYPSLKAAFMRPVEGLRYE